MRVTSHALGLEDPLPRGPPTDCRRHSRGDMRFARTFAGVVLVVNAYLAPLLPAVGDGVPAASALLGALLLGASIVHAALRDLRGGALNTSVLVALAITALFPSAHYAEAGIAGADLLPEIQFHVHDRWKLSAALLAGIGTALLIVRLAHAAP